jgi:hypothetical protein
VAFAGAPLDSVEAWLRCGPAAARHTVVIGRLVVETGQRTASRLDDMLTRQVLVTRIWRTRHGRFATY